MPTDSINFSDEWKDMADYKYSNGHRLARPLSETIQDSLFRAWVLCVWRHNA